MQYAEPAVKNRKFEKISGNKREYEKYEKYEEITGKFKNPRMQRKGTGYDRTVE